MFAQLVILGKEGLDTLEAMAVTHFSAIANKGAVVPLFTGPVFRPQDVAKHVRWWLEDSVLCVCCVCVCVCVCVCDPFGMRSRVVPPVACLLRNIIVIALVDEVERGFLT